MKDVVFLDDALQLTTHDLGDRSEDNRDSLCTGRFGGGKGSENIGPGDEGTAKFIPCSAH